MVEKFEFKLIALLLAFLLYVGLLFGIYYIIKGEHKEKKDYGFNVEDAIVVDIDTLLKEKPKPITPVPKPIVPKKLPKPEPQVQKIAEPVEPRKEIPNKEMIKKTEKPSRDKIARSAKDLFSTIRSDKYEKAIKQQQRQKATKASRLKKQQEKLAREKALREKKRKQQELMRKKRAKEAQKVLEDLQISQATRSSKKKGQEHKYWSFVSSKIMAKWQRTVSTQNGLKGSALIKIDKNGRLTYTKLKLSGNSLFDTKLKVFLDNLEYERFPAYKEAPYIEAVFEFKDKEKGL